MTGVALTALCINIKNRPFYDFYDRPLYNPFMALAGLHINIKNRPLLEMRRLDDPMKMIRHEDIGVNLPTRLGASLAQRVDEALAIRVIHDDQFAPVTAIHDVINRASILGS